MKSKVTAGLVILATAVSTAAQALPTTSPRQRPTLKRDRTRRILMPKIIQWEDERVVTDELLDLLGSSHAGVRRRAIIALGRIGSPIGVAPLITVLSGDRNAQMRADAAFALGEIESHLAVGVLVERVDDAGEDHMVRGRSLEALGKITASKHSAAILGNYGTNAIAGLIARTLPPPSKQLSDGDRFIASLALTALLRIKKASTIAPITTQLQSSEPGIKWRAANALARIPDGVSTAVPRLLGLLDDPDPLVRAYAARALGVAKDKSAVDPLIKKLADQNTHVIANSVAALGALGDRRAVEPLTELGGRLLAVYRSIDRSRLGAPPEQNLLLLIVTALGDIGDTRAIALIRSLRAVEGRLGAIAEAEIALAKLGEQAFFDVLPGVRLPEDDWKAVAAYAGGLGELRTDRARSSLQDLMATRPDARAIPSILNAMAATKVEGLRDILLQHLKAKDVMVKTTAATLLGDLGDQSTVVVTALEQSFKDSRDDEMNDARIAMIEAGHKLRSSLPFQVLSGPLRDPDYVVRSRASELLFESAGGENMLKSQVGKVETGHDRTYWRRVADLSLSAKNPVAVIHTRKGDIRVELFASDAPMTVDNFIQLSRRGFYNGLSFHRVVPNFVIQGGDPRGDMNGGPGYQIRCEINQREYGVGAVGMALSGKDTGGSQFFITHSPQPHLNGGYTVFGQVIGGMDVVNRVARDDLIEKIEIIRD